jgi:hypothetical protein
VTVKVAKSLLGHGGGSFTPKPVIGGG